MVISSLCEYATCQKLASFCHVSSTFFWQEAINTLIRLKLQNGYVPSIKYCHLQFFNMVTYSSWITILWSIFNACCTSKHPFLSAFYAEKGLHVIHACVIYTPFYSIVCKCIQFGKLFFSFSGQNYCILNVFLNVCCISSIIDLIETFDIIYYLTSVWNKTQYKTEKYPHEVWIINITLWKSAWTSLKM